MNFLPALLKSQVAGTLALPVHPDQLVQTKLYEERLDSALKALVHLISCCSLSLSKQL